MRQAMSGERLFGCVEGGGTKFLCAVAASAEDVRATVRIPTTTPRETLPRVIAWLRGAGLDGADLAAIGLACFGPVIVDRNDPQWGHIGRTTKPGWTGTDLAGAFARAFDRPVGFDTDVNGAALGEVRWGAARGCDVAAYLTIGTGIGGGATVDGAPLHGLRHPEMGHIIPPRHRDDRLFNGICPYHGDCAEGLASGPAIIARWGAPLSELPPDHPGHAIIGWYLGHLCATAMALLSPRRIVMGGGVMATPGLIDHVRAAAAQVGSGYFTVAGRDEDYATIIVPSALGDRSGVLGALALAQDAAGEDIRSVFHLS